MPIKIRLLGGGGGAGGEMSFKSKQVRFLPGTYVQRGSMFCFVVLLLVVETLVRSKQKAVLRQSTLPDLTTSAISILRPISTGSLHYAAT
jgi:hypothetical protein